MLTNQAKISFLHVTPRELLKIVLAIVLHLCGVGPDIVQRNCFIFDPALDHDCHVLVALVFRQFDTQTEERVVDTHVLVLVRRIVGDDLRILQYFGETVQGLGSTLHECVF
jgi:hypothetical protein